MTMFSEINAYTRRRRDATYTPNANLFPTESDNNAPKFRPEKVVERQLIDNILHCHKTNLVFLMVH